MTYDYNQFLTDMILQDNHELINNLNEPSLDQLKSLVDRGLFKYFKDDWKSEEICLRAVKKDWHAIQYIENQSEDVQMAAVLSNFYAIQYIKQPFSSVVEYLFTC